jgi:hypothetical protein
MTEDLEIPRIMFGSLHFTGSLARSDSNANQLDLRRIVSGRLGWNAPKLSYWPARLFNGFPKFGMVPFIKESGLMRCFVLYSLLCCLALALH